jgi:hypothetical protein
MNDLSFFSYLLQYGGIAIIAMAVWMLYKLVVVLRQSIGKVPHIMLVRATLSIILTSAGFFSLGIWLMFSAQTLTPVIVHFLW